MTSTGRMSTSRQSIIRPRSSSAAVRSSSRAESDGSTTAWRSSGGRSSGSVATRWFGTIRPVSANQNRDRPVSTRPLSGIGVGRTTSNADSRSEATSRSWPSPMRYRSRTLPERTKRLASDTAGHLQSLEAGDDRRHVTEGGRVVEAGVEGRRREALRDGRVEGEEIAQLAALIGRPQRRRAGRSRRRPPARARRRP